jgi:hypothetical protein
MFEPLRKDPRFQKLVASSAPKSVVRGARSAQELQSAMKTPSVSGRVRRLQWQYVVSKRESKKPADCAREMRPHN